MFFVKDGSITKEQEILFGRNGECALFIEDTDDNGANNDETDTAMAVFLLPKIYTEGSEYAEDFLCGRGGYFLEKELYNE